MNIYEKMLAITSELSRVAKNLEVGFGQNKYKATGEADVLAAIKPLEEKYKVYSYPVKREILDTGELETKTGNKNLFMRVGTTYRFVNTEKPEEYIDMISYGDGVDSQDKAPGKAMTYSDKYSLMKAYKIITGDDPDQNISEELKGKTKAQTKEPAQKDYAVILATPEQVEILSKQDKKVIEWMKKKFGVTELNQLPKATAEAVINQMKEKGALK